MLENISLIIAAAAIVTIICLQLKFFISTLKKIKTLESFFPSIEKLSLKETSITPQTLRSTSALKSFLNHIPSKQEREVDEEEDDYMDVMLLELDTEAAHKYEAFNDTLKRTNAYLCKNVGTSADFNLLKDISEQRLDALESEISNTLNVPLFLGLGGTFIGIILGLWGVDFAEILSNTTEIEGLQHLLWGVVMAMAASLLGLMLTVYNSAFAYKKSLTVVDTNKEDYFDFLRRELMPVLSSSMSSSLNSLKSVLGNFVGKFGRNLDAYADSAALLNDNLEKQHLVLEEINQLSLTKTANKIAETFVTLKDASDSLNVFKSYQDQLNTTTRDVAETIAKFNALLSNFDEFKTGLITIVQNQNNTFDLQRTFRDAIETHFPTGGEGRDVWRNEFDLLMKEAKLVSDNVSTQLEASTEYIQNFVADNKNFFNSFDNLNDVILNLVEYTKVQSECYRDLKGEILNLRKDYKDAQIDSMDLNKSILQAVKTMTEALNDNKKE